MGCSATLKFARDMVGLCSPSLKLVCLLLFPYAPLTLLPPSAVPVQQPQLSFSAH